MNEQPTTRHILYVDDDPASQRIVERVLRTGIPGVRVTCANNGVMALQVLERESIDLLITDLHMPGMDGIELLRQVSTRRIALPVIVVTAHGSPTHETRALADGAFEYFEKPIQAEPFLRCVQELLEDGRHRSRIEGLSIAGFVQLLSMERKTCALRASIPGAQGVLYFNAGALVDARQGELSGVGAALEIFTWKEPLITLEAQARGRPITINLGVTELLLESARVADERERNLRRSVQSRTTMRGEAQVAAAGGSRGPVLSLVPSAPAPTAAARRPTPRPVPAPPPPRPPVATWEEPEAQATIARLLEEAMKIDGVTGAAVANWELDDSLGVLGERRGLEIAVSGNCRVMRALMSAMARLGLQGRVQDVLITLDEQSHILWPLPQHENVFLYLTVDRTRGNLALTRHRLAKIVESEAF